MAVGAVANAATCALVRIEEWPVRVVRNHLIVDGAVNGKSAGVMVDTGATSSLILRSAAGCLGLPRQESKNIRVFGIGGETRIEIARVASFRIGTATRSGWDLIIAGERDFGSPIGVVLGEDFFQSTDVEFDLAQGVIRLFQARGCDGASLACWTKEAAGVVEIETVLAARPQIVLEGKINGRPVSALLDSGAVCSILPMADAASAGITPESPGFVKVDAGMGLGKNAFGTWLGPVRSFSIGTETIRDTAIRFGDLYKGITYTETGSACRQTSENSSRYCSAPTSSGPIECWSRTPSASSTSLTWAGRRSSLTGRRTRAASRDPAQARRRSETRTDSGSGTSGTKRDAQPGLGIECVQSRQRK